MTNSSSSRPLPQELVDELATRSEGSELAQVWELLALADPVPGSPEAAAVWDRVNAQISSGQSILTPAQPVAVVTAPRLRVQRPNTTPATSRPGWRYVAPWALAATLAVAVGFSAWSARSVTVEAPIGKMLTVALPDGSIAELNAGSSLEYRRSFRRLAGLAAAERSVVLNGEAYFSVVTGSRPFSVATDQAQVTVLGTRFLVRAHRDEDEGTRVAVESGRVRVTANEGNTGAVELGAGEGTLVARGAHAPELASVVGVDRIEAWRRGGFWLVDQPLSAIFRELERRYAVDIRLKDVQVGDERLNVYYPERPSIETILSDLCTRGGLRYSRTSRGFEITPQPELPVSP